MKVQIGLAGLPYEVELRYWLACTRLMPSPTPVQLRKWDGRHCDILVVDLDSEAGRLAYQLARHRAAHVLFLSNSQPGDHLLGTHVDRHATASAIAQMLEPMLQTVPARFGAAATGLLGLCALRDASSHELLAGNGTVSVVLRHSARRIYASSREELEVAKRQLLDTTWSCVAITAPREDHYEGLLSESLDSFLVAACHRLRSQLLPISDTAYRLAAWPDLIAFPDNREALRLSSALYRKGWHVQSLASHCGVSTETANAFCWAMHASGALKLDDGSEETRLEPANDAPWEQPVPQVVLPFALKTRRSHA